MIAAPQQTKRRLMDVRKSPEYWGRWFTPIWGRVKQTNLNIFFQLGAALQDLVDLHTGMPMGDILMKVVIVKSMRRYRVTQGSRLRQEP